LFCIGLCGEKPVLLADLAEDFGLPNTGAALLLLPLLLLLLSMLLFSPTLSGSERLPLPDDTD